VLVRSKIIGATRTSNVADLAITDFYTFIRDGNVKDSSFESILGEVEGATAPIVDQIYSPFVRPGSLTYEQVARLAQFAAFQLVRGPRSRRAAELQAEWFAKMSLSGTVETDELSNWTITPHQNTVLQATLPNAEEMVGFFLNRPLTVIRLDRPRLLIVDEPVVALGDRAGVQHRPECRQNMPSVRTTRKRKRRRPRTDQELVHFWSTAERGVGVADEVVLPIGPRMALHWGSLAITPQIHATSTETLGAEDSARFASVVNDRQCDQALDWVISRLDDTELATRNVPAPAPLIGICDGGSPASAHLNRAPSPARPGRLTVPDASRPST
jgi:hypothetical protein